MIDQLMDHAQKRRDKKAIRVLERKSKATQLLWKDQKNPYY